MNAIRGLKGTTDWKDRAVTTFQYLLTFKADVGHTHGNPVDGHTHDEFKALDILGVSRQIVTNMTITRDTKNRITQMDYTTSEDTGSIVFHRNTSGKLDCTRLSSLILSNLHTTQVQIELIRDNSGAVTSIFRSGFNAVLQSGLVWPIT